jgi:hypothetical protein
MRGSLSILIHRRAPDAGARSGADPGSLFARLVLMPSCTRTIDDRHFANGDPESVPTIDSRLRHDDRAASWREASGFSNPRSASSQGR